MSEVRMLNDKIIRILNTPPLASGELIPDGVKLVGAPAMWEDTKGEGAIVAILDTGIDATHLDLAGAVIAGKNFSRADGYNPNIYADHHGHGTHVAGTIAARMNGGGVVGVAPAARLLIGKVLGDQGEGDEEWIAAGIRWAADWRGQAGERAHIINMSLGAEWPMPKVHEAIKYAVDQGVIVIVAAGNSGDGKDETEEIAWPAYYPEVVSVGAVDVARKKAYFTVSNPEVDLAGPGVHTFSTWPGNKWVEMDGTSMATPHISGAAALIVSKYLKRTGQAPTEEALYHMLKFLTNDVESLGIDASTGAGVFCFLPASIDYDGQKAKRIIKMKIGDKTYTVDGVAKQMDTYPRLIDGRTMVPVRFVSEGLGAAVNWDEPTKTVTIEG